MCVAQRPANSLCLQLTALILIALYAGSLNRNCSCAHVTVAFTMLTAAAPLDRRREAFSPMR
jgi:hypothetical protein